MVVVVHDRKRCTKRAVRRDNTARSRSEIVVIGTARGYSWPTICWCLSPSLIYFRNGAHRTEQRWHSVREHIERSYAVSAARAHQIPSVRSMNVEFFQVVPIHT